MPHKYDYRKLRRLIVQSFSEEELRTLCFDLGVDYDDLDGRGKSGKARELVASLRRKNQIPAILDLLHKERPDIDWPPFPDEAPPWPESPNDWADRLAKPIILGAISVAGLILVWLLLRGLLPFRPAAPTPVSTTFAFLPTGTNPPPIDNPELVPSTSGAPATSLSATPPVLPHLTVNLSHEGCETLIAQITDDVQREGAEVDESSTGQMTIQMTCEGEQVSIVVDLPDKPATFIELLDEPGTLTVTSERVYGRTFVRAVILYALGDYESAARMLEQDSERLAAPDAHYLLAQALMHSERWQDARDYYESVLSSSSDADVERAAQAHAGTGLAYILQTEQANFAEPLVHEACILHAPAEFELAIAEQPARPLWRLGKAKALESCPPTDTHDPNAVIRPIVERALSLSENAEPYDRALALAMMSEQLIFGADRNPSLALEYTQQAREILPESPLPYLASTIIYCMQGNKEAATSDFQSHLDRLAFDWQRQRARQRTDSMFATGCKP